MKKLPVILIVLALVGGLCGCGYKLSGFGSQVPGHIRTIAIPDFDNKTTQYQVEQYITFAVKEEFIQRSNLVLVERASQADSLLEGTITRFTVVPATFGEEGSANLYRINIEVSVRFIDLKTNDIIFEGRGISFNDTYEIDNEEFTSQETETMIKMAEEVAASVVTSIMENF
jgi:outer membrane lipopolysaccharide assembly protein LptE/RlpB